MARIFLERGAARCDSLRLAGVLVMVLFLAACTNKPAADTEAGDAMIACSDPRPQMCTMDYRPVCAFLEAGGRREYSNGCSACSDPGVTGYVEGACSE